MKIKKIVLQTARLKALEEFYSVVLELPVQSLKGNEIKISVGTTNLIFTAAKGEQPFYHFAINIPSNKIEEAKAWLSKKVKLLWIEDYKSDVADFVNWHAKSVYFYDAAGNILELIARFDLDNPSDQPFSSEQFLSISEMGFVFNKDDFDKNVSALLNNYSLSYFDKQPPLPHFRAIGDDEGLFIAVPQHRNWYPTDKPSGIFPMLVEFENKAVEYKLKS
jgi:hypothetical protein